MLDISRDIQSLSNFKRNTYSAIAQMKQTGEPIILTVNGKAEVVVQDAKSYQQLLEKIEKLEAVAGIKQGLAEIKSGKTRPVAEFMQEMQQKHGISS
ncbi:prevent-host-death family protein [Stanieria cyanosphaera PCC 7437]|uniref:Antitoxin n=1 Tax=Stanieria cyanosphaera (strain ATCC 29371 / PCC 7437) TaxID=111780 RepID=K9XQS8_STAC7|nr:type II toxin-antitoxin system Phd/YefM family antitoxin [Stanieria cyanosphaera]AFZ34970.1 prevent-host-death family protein [Stanieria cyanosphaera PCC 7437]